MAGLEVDSVSPAAADFTGVVIGEVLQVTAHSNADKLRICTVSIGDKEPLQIVCGAANVGYGHACAYRHHWRSTQQWQAEN